MFSDGLLKLPFFITQTFFKKHLTIYSLSPRFHKLTYHHEKHNPDFDTKVHNVLIIYKQIELCFDKECNLTPFFFYEQAVHALHMMKNHAYKHSRASKPQKAGYSAYEPFSYNILLDSQIS